jgi:hypothetical protein
MSEPMSGEHGMNQPAASASGSDGLERGYRRLLAFYPRWFRRENGEEILAVLLACAQDGQTRPSLEAAVDLLKGAARMRLRPRPGQPRTVFAAVRLMWAGALAELAGLVIVVSTAASVRATVKAKDPAAEHALLVHLIADVVAAPIAIGLWLCLAWANSQGRDAARLASAACFCLLTLSLLGSLAQGAVAYAPAAMIAGTVIWLIGLASLVLVFTPASNRYFRTQSAEMVSPAG